MEFNIPISYNLYINDILQYVYSFYDNIYIIDNFILFTNKNNIIYKIYSTLSLENLLFSFNKHYKNPTIIKIYDFLIIKYLLTKKNNIKNEWFFHFLFKKKYYDKLISYGEYYVCNNNKIIITSKLNFNICFIFNNLTLKKSIISLINPNSDIKHLIDIINKNNLYINSKKENIYIYLIGGNNHKFNNLSNIYKLLDCYKLSKFIKFTYILKKKPIKMIVFNSYKNKIKFTSYFKFYTKKN
jgi:hypothetical protein